jgi:DNA-directed RNA polymerase subunit RPC12/RpoP
MAAVEFYKCTDCWRVYSEADISTGLFAGCKCQNVRFNGRRSTRWNRFKHWLGRFL